MIGETAGEQIPDVRLCKRPAAWPLLGKIGVLMVTAELTLGGLLVLAMIAVSVRGWLTLPSDARVPIRHRFGGYGGYLSKTAGLVAWPAGGIIVYGLFVGVFVEGLATHYRGTGATLLFMPVVLAVLTTVQVGAIRAAGRSSGRG